MGNRSNVNIITEYKATGEVVGLNVYMHWGGTGAQFDALDAADGPAYDRREQADYFARCVARAVTGGLDGETGAGFTPFVVKDAPAAYGYILDNQHPVLAFDLVKQVVVIAHPAFGDEPAEIVAEYPLDHDGIEQARQALVPECSPEANCVRCAARAEFEAQGLTRVQAEAAAERAEFEPGYRFIMSLAGRPGGYVQVDRSKPAGRERVRRTGQASRASKRPAG